MIDKRAIPVSVEVAANGTLYVNSEDCLLRIVAPTVLTVRDHRPEQKLSLRRFTWRDEEFDDPSPPLDIHTAKVRWNLTFDELDELLGLEVGDMYARPAASNEIITRVK